VTFGALMLAIGLLIGDLPTMSFFWLAIFAVGWVMKRHPNETLRLIAGRLPSRTGVLDLIVVTLAGVAAVALGAAVS
jgi:hypothetical protein